MNLKVPLPSLANSQSLKGFHAAGRGKGASTTRDALHNLSRIGRFDPNLGKRMPRGADTHARAVREHRDAAVAIFARSGGRW
jgi:hypothetical protein